MTFRNRSAFHDEDVWSQLAIAAAVVIPLGLDLYLPAPEENPLTAEKIALGRQLFFDPRLSRDGSVSCASCHLPGRAFSDGRTLAAGIGGRVGRRNAPALVNRGYGRAFFWDARLTSLELLKYKIRPSSFEPTLLFPVFSPPDARSHDRTGRRRGSEL